MRQTTFVLSTSRAIRARQLEASSLNTFLPNYLTMSEFLSRVIYINKKIILDSDERTLLLMEASRFSRFDKLKIERNFYSFLKNSQYIFKFFEELSGELIDIKSLMNADVYGDYEEHITILRELYERYKELCYSKNIIDPIFVKSDYNLNANYIKNLGEIYIELEGYITNYEFELLRKCSEFTEIKLKFFASEFNVKVQSRFENILMNAYNIVNIRTLEVEHKEKVDKSLNVKVDSFSERLSQVAFIKESVYRFISQGMKAENIVVVLPSESFATYLQLHDEKHNFNFAMGTSLKTSYSLSVLQACCDYLENRSVQNQQRLNRYNFYGIEKLSEFYYDVVDVTVFESVVNYYLEIEESKNIKKLLLEEMFHFSKILPSLHELHLKSILHLFLKRCYKQTIDDVRGGKITVMGVLETRGIAYEGVIVVDFNEDVVPHKSEKDLFLNATTRHHAKLPSSEDRENLQKHYYYMLFLNAKEVSLSYVMSEVAKPSRFLMQLGIESSKTNSDENYISILYKEEKVLPFKIEEKEIEFNFKNHTFSASSLKSYLQCKKQFYYRYVAKILGDEIISEMPQEHAIGNSLHNALNLLYSNKKSYSDLKSLQNDFKRALYTVSGSSELEKYQLKLWQEQLLPFFENEIERFKSGSVVHSCEESLKAEVNGMQISGKIDRVDLLNNSYLQVIDYKSGSYPTYSVKTLDKAVDFQLEFYKLLVQANSQYEIDAEGGCFYYELKSGKLIPEVILELKLEKLKEHLEYLKHQNHFINEKCEDLSRCTFCDYKILCERD